MKLEKRFSTGSIKRSIVPYLLKAAVVTLLLTLSSLWTGIILSGLTEEE